MNKGIPLHFPLDKSQMGPTRPPSVQRVLAAAASREGGGAELQPVGYYPVPKRRGAAGAANGTGEEVQQGCALGAP